MTGYGAAEVHREQLTCAVEIRAVNNRYLKISVRLADAYGALESPLEKLVRDQLRRGTINVNVRWSGSAAAVGVRLNKELLQGLLAELRGLVAEPSNLLGALIGIPGVVEHTTASVDPEAQWPILAEAVQAALGRLQTMRQDEGAAMAAELRQIGAAIAERVEAIEQRTPEALVAYRDRLMERVNTLLLDHQHALQPNDLMRELSILAERVDVAEEITRLRSHLAQFHDFLDASESSGRKLEFLSQEMHREANTLGAKANDIRISAWVVELKTQVERLREIVQNVE